MQVNQLDLNPLRPALSLIIPRLLQSVFAEKILTETNMRKPSAILFFTGMAILSTAISSAQITPSAGTGTGARTLQQHLIGEVTASDPATGQLTVKTDAGASVVVTSDEKT